MEIQITHLQGESIRGVVRGEFVIEVPRGRHTNDLAAARIIVPEIDPVQLQAALDYATAEVVSDVSYYPHGIDVDGTTVFAERTYRLKDDIYIMRDVSGAPERWIVCQYATKDEDGNKVWHRCTEGAAFDEIEPFEKLGASE